MSEYVVRLPDVGEGVAEAELVDWHVAVGDAVTPDTILAEVLTDKATVEIFAPRAGVVTALHGEPGQVLPVGGPLVALAVEAGDVSGGELPEPTVTAPPEPAPAALPEPAPAAAPEPASAGASLARGLAAPAVRSRARALGIGLSDLTGTGPGGRITHADLDRMLTRGGAVPTTARDEIVVEPVRGLRRKIAERMTAAWTQIPHITYVEAIDVTELEALRVTLNERGDGPRLTPLAFIARAVVLAVADQPRLNAHYDAAAESLSIFESVHLGIATQTPDGLAVPVLRHAETLGLHEAAAAIADLAAATREGKATREVLSGSTITISSLGALGGVVTTPILNAPEVAILGVNKLETRPVWRDGAFVPRQIFNVSASFDHRIVDGWDAATFVQRVKQLLEQPALLFVDAL